MNPVKYDVSNLPKPIPKRLEIKGSLDASIQWASLSIIGHAFRPYEIGKGSFFCRPWPPVKQLTKGLRVIKVENFEGKKKADWVRANECTPRYVIYGHLGKGTFGTVSRGKDQLTGKKVAIKVIDESDEEDAENGRSEHKTYLVWRSLKIPHVVEFHAGFLLGEYRWLVMEKMPTNLAAQLTTREKIPFDEGLSIFRQLLEMHQKLSSIGSVHGDLTLANIGYNPETREVKVYDLGAAHSVKDPKIDPFQTTWYRAPEMFCSSVGYDSSIDLWSIGCIVFECFTGEPFARGDDEVETLCEIIWRIGRPPDHFYPDKAFANRQFLRAYMHGGVGDLNIFLQKEADQRGFSKEQSELFIKLLRSILRYEGRIAPDEALQLLDAIPKQTSSEEKRD